MEVEDAKHVIDHRVEAINALLGVGKREAALQGAASLRDFINQHFANGEFAEEMASIEKAIAQLQSTQTLDPGGVHPFVVLAVALVAFICGLLVGRSSLRNNVASVASSVPPSVVAPPAVVSASQAPSPSPLPVGSGAIEGTLTYYFNENYGTKPDTGAEVFLLQGESADVTGSNDAFVAAAANPYKSTMADGQGTFRLPSIPPGTYTVLIRSSHANSEDHLAGKLYQKTVVVRDKDTVDVSHDFGMTYISM